MPTSSTSVSAFALPLGLTAYGIRDRRLPSPDSTSQGTPDHDRPPRRQRPAGPATVGHDPRERMLETFRETFASFGFVPIETPHIERMEVLTGKGAGSDEVLRQIFEVTNKGGTPGELALRFDLTVPLARFIARHVDELGRALQALRHRLGLPRRTAGQGPVPRVHPVRLRHRRHRKRPSPTPRPPRSSTPPCPPPACRGSPSHLNNRKVLDGLLESFGVIETKGAVLRVPRQARQDRPRRRPLRS